MTDYQYSLSARSATILNDNFYYDQPNIRFGILEYHEWEDIKETLYLPGPSVVVLKDGVVYRNDPMQDTYHLVHQFIEDKIPSNKVFD